MTLPSSGQKGDGYIPVISLENYSAKQLRLVRERVVCAADRIHDILEGRGGSIEALTLYLRGEAALPNRLDAVQDEAA